MAALASRARESETAATSCGVVTLAVPTEPTAVDNAFLPVDVGALEKKRKRLEPLSVRENRIAWQDLKTSVDGTFGDYLVRVELLPGAAKENLFLIMGGSTRLNFVQLSPVDPSSEKRQIVSTKSFARIKTPVQHFATRFPDRRVVATADLDGVVQVVDIKSRTHLRRLHSPSGGNPVCCCFSPDNPKLLLCGTDTGDLKLWDISDGGCLGHLAQAHTDRVQFLLHFPPKTTAPSASGATVSPPETTSWVSGGSDGQVKLWRISATGQGGADCASSTTLDSGNSTFQCFGVIDHGAPVETAALFSSATMLVTGGGTYVKVWDLLAVERPRLLHAILAHTKTVTAVAIAPDGSYICSGSLDRTVKFLCPSSGRALHAITCEDSVGSLSAAREIAGTRDCIAIGFKNGSWRVVEKICSASAAESFKTARRLKLALAATRVNTREYFRRGKEFTPPLGTTVLKGINSKRSNKIDLLLQGFRFHESFDRALSNGVGAVVALCNVLIEQGSLQVALRGRDHQSIMPTVKFLNRHLGRDLFATETLLELARSLLAENQWMRSTTSVPLLRALQQLNARIEKELSQHDILENILGLIELASNVAT